METITANAYRSFVFSRRQLFSTHAYPESAWTSQQLLETFPYNTAPKHLIHERGATFSEEVDEAV